MKSPRAFLVCLWVGFLAGCIGREGLERELRLGRAHAYRSWAAQRRRDPLPDAVLEGGCSLQDALRHALRDNKELQAVAEERAVAKGLRLESLSELLPRLSAFASYARLNKTPAVEAFGLELEIGDENNWAVGVRLRQPLLRTGADFARIRAAKLSEVLADEAVRQRVHEIVFEAAKLYADILLEQGLFEANRDAAHSSEAQLKEVKARREAGTASDYEVARAEVELSNFRAEVIRRRHRSEVSMARLLRVMGVSQDSRLRLTDRLEYVPLRPQLERAVEVAFANRPELYIAELRRRIQDERVAMALSRYGPSVDAFFDFAYARPDLLDLGDKEWGVRWAVGVALDWTLFDGLKREGQVAQERALLRRRGIELRAVEERILSEVRQALATLRAAAEFVESQRNTVERARRALRLAEVGYREGTRSQVEITDARSALTRARSLYLEALHGHAVGRLSLQGVMGLLGPRLGEREDAAARDVRPGRIEEFERK